MLLALVSAVQFYAHATAAIGVWVTPEYEPLFQAAFNLVVLAVALLGAGRQLRRIDAA